MGAATRLFGIIAAIGVLFGSPARAAEEVDLLLVLSSDVSRSVDAPKFKLQRDGYASAIVNPRVIQAIRSGSLGKIGVSFVEWSGVGAQRIVIDWTIIRDEATAKDFSAQIIEAPRAFADRTSISGGIDLPWRSSRERRSSRAAAPSMCPATAPTIRAATLPMRAMRPSRRASPSMVSSS